MTDKDTVTVEATPGDEVCDFCNDPDIVAQHECQNFELDREEFIFGSLEGWAACQRCHDLVVSEDIDTLVEVGGMPGLPPVLEKQMKPLRRTLYEAFFKHRTGEWEKV